MMISHCSEQSQCSLQKRMCNSDDRLRSTLTNLRTPNCVGDDEYQWGLWGFYASGKCYIPKLLHCAEVFFSLRATGHKILFKKWLFIGKDWLIATTMMEPHLMCAIFGDKYLNYSNLYVFFYHLSLVFTMFFTTKESTPAVSDVCDWWGRDEGAPDRLPARCPSLLLLI